MSQRVTGRGQALSNGVFYGFLTQCSISEREIALRPSCLAFLAQRVYQGGLLRTGETQ
jgi:hypothetical protein